MRTVHFTTVVSASYVYKFLAMQESLEQHCKNYHLFALCVDKDAYKVLKRMSLNNATLLKASDFEMNELLTAKNNRCYHEYCWTLKPFILNYVMQKYNNTRYYAHIDADLFFYADPIEIFEESPDAPLYITDHNNSERFLQTYETSGIYNTGFVGCRNDETAKLAIEWWLNKCLEKCSLVAIVKEGLYGDQKYAERWPELFPTTHVVRTKGANVAQWNIERFYVSEKEDSVYVNSDRLIFYHFSGLSILSRNEFNLATFFRIEENPLKYIYMPYIKCLNKHMKFVTQMIPEFIGGISNRRHINLIHYEKI